MQDNNFDIIITDLSMPKMGGKELYYKVREFDKKIPFIMISGYSSERIAQIEDNLLVFIQKPFKYEYIRKKIIALLNICDSYNNWNI